VDGRADERVGTAWEFGASSRVQWGTSSQPLIESHAMWVPLYLLCTPGTLFLSDSLDGWLQAEVKSMYLLPVEAFLDGSRSTTELFAYTMESVFFYRSVELD
jgi:hypothetical protein